MNTKQLKYLLALAQEGSFSRAADALGITQPSLSQSVKKIEQEAGLPLFDRAGGEVRLTDAGRIYLDTGRQMLDLERRMESALSDVALNRFGSLVVGTSPYRAAGTLPEAARRFRERYPGVHLVIREGTTAELTDGMEHGEYDLCLTLLPLDERLFQWEKAAEEELVLAVPAGLPALPAEAAEDRKYPAVDARLLADKPFVMLTDAQFMQRQLRDLAADYGLTLPTAAVVKSLEAQIAMVRAGLGMALVPTGIERFCAEGEVTFYSFLQPLPRREAVVMWRRGRALPPPAEAFKEILKRIS